MHYDEFVEKAITEHLTPGFLECYQKAMLSLEMVTIINDICLVTSVANENGNAPQDPELAKLIKSTRLDVRLLSLSSDYRCPSSTRQYTIFEECLSLSLMIYLNNILQVLDTENSRSRYISTHHSAILANILSDPAYLNNAGPLLWIAFMGVFVEHELAESWEKQHVDERCEKGHISIYGRQPHLEPLAILCNKVQIRSLAEMERHLAAYLWIPNHRESFAKHLWQSVEAQRHSITDPEQLLNREA